MWVLNVKSSAMIKILQTLCYNAYFVDVKSHLIIVEITRTQQELLANER